MESWGHDIKVVGDQDVPELLGVDIVVCQFAEGGTQGNHGRVFLVIIDKRVFFTCYLEPSSFTCFSKSMTPKNLIKEFPPLSVFFGGMKGTTREWYYDYFRSRESSLGQDNSESLVFGKDKHSFKRRSQENPL